MAIGMSFLETSLPAGQARRNAEIAPYGQTIITLFFK